MTNEHSDTPQESQWRSKKYIRLSDEEILELSKKALPEKDNYYLLKELDYRNLVDKAREVKLAEVKEVMRSKQWWKYIPLIFALMFLVKQFMGS